MALNQPSMFDTQYAMDRQMQTDAMAAGQLPLGGGMMYASSLGGDMYNEQLMGLAGMLGGSPDPRIGKQQAIDEIQQRFPNPDTYEEFMELSNAFRLGGFYDYAEQAIKAANDTRSSIPAKSNDWKAYSEMTSDPTPEGFQKWYEKYKVTGTGKRQIVELVDGLKYYVNADGTVEQVKPGLEAPKDTELLATELVTSFGYADTLEQQEKLVTKLINEGFSGTEIYKNAITSLNVEKKLRQDVKLGIQRDQIRLSDRVSGSGIPEFEVTLSAAEAVIEKYAGKDIPGIGAGTLSITDEAKVAQSAKSALINTILKIRSGAAVTDPEFNRLQEEIAGKWNAVITDEDFRRWVKTLRSVQDRIVGSIFGGYRPEVKKAYWAAGGFKVKSKVTPEQLYNL